MNLMNGIELAWTPRNYSTGPIYKCEGVDYEALGKVVLRAIAAGQILPPKNSLRQCKAKHLKVIPCMVCGVNFERESASERKTCGAVCYGITVQRKLFARKQLSFACELCSAPFTSVKKNARFCSAKCNQRAAKTRARARKQLERNKLAEVQK
jgi:predicted nucleic acid-binding Zn ribbon protein